jgi:hypothetical protein
MRKKLFLFAIPIVATLFFLHACTKTENIAIPTVKDFTPESGLPGTTVTITGTNFDKDAAKNLVMIAGVQAEVTDASATSITATVSASAQTNSAGKVTVTAKGLTAVSADNFTVTATPPIATTKVTGEINADTHWTADQHYLLSGYVYVTSGHTLTIDPGTIIKGDKATKGTLIIEQGAKIMAIGTAAKPIIMTSNQPKGQRNYGDWGGLVLCGKAPVNWTAAPKTDGTTGTVASGFGQIEGGPRSLYGGPDIHDNSGTVQYVRVEFGGVAFSQDNEINGMTFGGVGDGTIIDHIQVSFAGDDSYEWFGGSVNAKYIIAHRGLDDDFDTDNGFSGKIQFGVGLRDPNVADQSGSKAFESDSYQTGTVADASLPTVCLFSNMTVIGGVTSPTSTAYDPQFVAGVHLRKGSKLQLNNSVVVGYPAGILLSNEGVANQSWNALNQPLVDVIHISNTIVGGVPTSSTRIAYGILPVNGAATATFDKNVVVVTNNTRSRTPTTPQADSVANVAWFTSLNGGTSYSGPYNWLGSNTYYNLTTNNRNYYTAQSGVRLVNPFTLTNPNFFPSSSSPIQVGLGALTGLGINASGPTPQGTQASPISPKVSPTFANSFNDPFFKLADGTFPDYIGAFKFGGTDWTLGWVSWDPNNADYGDAY